MHVVAAKDGVYEVFKIYGESPIQFTSESIGNYNEDLQLAVGNYLILGDCSSKTIIIRPNSYDKLVAHELTFTPPIEPNENDKFSIQCNRYEKTHSRQNFTNTFTLNVFPGERDLLVGMIPIKVNFDETANEPQTQNFKLSAVRVTKNEQQKINYLYFISPTTDQLSVTMGQDFGNWVFLLPGEFSLGVNGTGATLNLEESMQYQIDPAFISIVTSPEVDLAASAQINGSPLFVEINGNHWLNLNEVYPVIPGKIQLRLNGSDRTSVVSLTENQFLEKQARSVNISLNCPPWDWNCLGEREIILFYKDEEYPFVKGTTDVPLLFFEEDVWAGIEGSRGIKYKIPNSQTNTFLKLGRLELKPKYEISNSAVTDLVRIEANMLPFVGKTIDIQMDRTVKIPMLNGTYTLAQYSLSNDDERRRSDKTFHITSGEVTEVEYPVLITEKKYQTIQKTSEERKIVRRNILIRNLTNSYVNAWPLAFE